MREAIGSELLMCGIAGLFDTSSDRNAVVAGMLKAIAHRGPDDEGTWSDPRSGITLGHRRLAVIDVSAAGHQPMRSASGRFVVSYNGEIYNFSELRNALERDSAAPSWHGHSDTEVMLAGFEHWGITETLRRCNGMFAIAVWDSIRHELTLGRDRIGEKPLYLGWIGGRFSFASELKAFSGIPGWAPKMDAASITTFLRVGYTRGLQSPIERIYRLPAGCTLALSASDMREPRNSEWVLSRLSHYWSLRTAAIAGARAPIDDLASASTSLEELLSDAVAIRMIADVPLGSFLSGGIDSSLITALMQRHSSAPIKTFCIGFDEAAFDEAPYAKAIARHLGTDHYELYVTANDALSLIPTLAEKFDEPFADHSQIPTLLVSRLARQHVAVALSGDGGDELFGGYGRYFAISSLWRSVGWTPLAWRQRGSRSLDFASALLQPFMSGADSIPFRMRRLAERVEADGLDAMRTSFIAGAGSSLLSGRAFPRETRSPPPWPTEVHGVLRRIMFGDQLDYLPDNILHKLDRASMTYALEARAPFLDHRVVEFSWRLPTSALVRGRRGKLVLRRLLARHVPERLFERPKQGFSPPMCSWLRGPLREWADDLLSPSELRELPLIDSEAVLALWKAHKGGRINAEYALWNVLMLSCWRKRFGVGS